VRESNEDGQGAEIKLFSADFQLFIIPFYDILH